MMTFCLHRVFEDSPCRFHGTEIAKVQKSRYFVVYYISVSYIFILVSVDHMSESILLYVRQVHVAFVITYKVCSVSAGSLMHKIVCTFVDILIQVFDGIEIVALFNVDMAFEALQ